MYEITKPTEEQAKAITGAMSLNAILCGEQTRGYTAKVGKTAASDIDNRTIFFDHEASGEALKLLNLHEIAHIIHTEIRRKAIEKRKINWQFLNGIEDQRIETLMIAEFPKLKEKYLKLNDMEGYHLTDFILIWGRRIYLTEKEIKESEAEFVKKLEKSLKAEEKEGVAETGSLPGLAKEVLAKVKSLIDQHTIETKYLKRLDIVKELQDLLVNSGMAQESGGDFGIAGLPGATGSGIEGSHFFAIEGDDDTEIEGDGTEAKDAKGTAGKAKKAKVAKKYMKVAGIKDKATEEKLKKEIMEGNKEEKIETAAAKGKKGPKGIGSTGKLPIEVDPYGPSSWGQTVDIQGKEVPPLDSYFSEPELHGATLSRLVNSLSRFKYKTGQGFETEQRSGILDIRKAHRFYSSGDVHIFKKYLPDRSDEFSINVAFLLDLFDLTDLGNKLVLEMLQAVNKVVSFSSGKSMVIGWADDYTILKKWNDTKIHEYKNWGFDSFPSAIAGMRRAYEELQKIKGIRFMMILSDSALGCDREREEKQPYIDLIKRAEADGINVVWVSIGQDIRYESRKMFSVRIGKLNPPNYTKLEQYIPDFDRVMQEIFRRKVRS